MSLHSLKVLNFVNLEVVDYPLIKLLGSVKDSASCPHNDIVRFSTDSSSGKLKFYNNTFKFLCQLQLGKNNISIKHCCDKISLVIEYLPQNAKYPVVPLYVICEGHDGCFQAPPNERNSIDSACQRIDLCIQLLQCLTAEKLFDYNLGRKTFRVDRTCQVFYSKLNYLAARKMKQLDLWDAIGKEIMKSKGGKKEKYLAFLSCTKYCGEKYSDKMQTYEELVELTEGYIALGGGDLALFGTACLYTWPEKFKEITDRFTNNSLVDRSQFLDDSCYRATVGSCFSTTLGSVLHELYHTFNLGHTTLGIMARGFDDIYKFFVNEAQVHPKENIASLYRRSINDSFPTKNFFLVKRTEEVDDTDLTKSCAVLLFFHKWFNVVQPKVTQLTFDVNQRLIKSTSGIRVIEIRTIEEELVLYDWVFLGKVLKFSFQIPEDVTKEIDNNKFKLVVEDNVGNILKKEYAFISE